MRVTMALAALALIAPGIAGAASKTATLTAMRAGTPEFTESSDKQARAIAECVRKDAAWRGAARVTDKSHGIAMLVPTASPRAALDIAEEGERRKVTLWPAAEGSAPETDAAKSAARLAAIKACI